MNRRPLVVLNLTAALAFAAGLVYVYWFPTLDARMKVTELDRARIIDEPKLKEIHPALGKDVRGLLGPWIAEWDHEAANLACGAGLVLSILNLLVLSLASPRVRRLSEGKPVPPPLPPQAGPRTGQP